MRKSGWGNDSIGIVGCAGIAAQSGRLYALHLVAGSMQSPRGESILPVQISSTASRELLRSFLNDAGRKLTWTQKLLDVGVVSRWSSCWW